MYSYAIKGGGLEEVDDDDVDFEFLDPSHFVASNVNTIPLQNAVQAPRLFYGARFVSQAQPLKEPESPLVQNLDSLDPEGRSFEDKFGTIAGAIRADEDGTVDRVDDEHIWMKYPSGVRKLPYFTTLPYNRKSGIDQKLVVKAGDAVKKGQLLARSNYTDANGTLALGANLRVALVADRGRSMDDATVISRTAADRLTSDHMETFEQDWDDHTRGGVHHFTALFPKRFTLDQLKNVDDEGFVKPGTVLQPGDPISLATVPRTISSASAAMGAMSRGVRVSRRDASQVWDEKVPGVVTDVYTTKTGKRAVIRSYRPAEEGDKIVFRSGAKGTISRIIDDERMPRTEDGQALEVLSNQLGLNSRANSNLPVELLFGKLAKAQGKAIKLPSFNKKGESWEQMVTQKLAEAGIVPDEKVFDPELGAWLRNPVTVGNGFVMKLHHTSRSKASGRGTASYDQYQQPAQGGGEGAQAKRLSGLETHALLSSGGYATLKEGATVRGQRNDSFWKALRQGQTPRPPGRPFTWDMFLALLNGTGMMARDLGGGKLRLGPFTDRDLAAHKPVEVRHGGMIDLRTLEPKPGGLFDSSLTAANKWGVIPLPRPVPNPAFEESVRALTGLTRKEFADVLAGRAELPAHLLPQAQ